MRPLVSLVAFFVSLTVYNLFIFNLYSFGDIIQASPPFSLPKLFFSAAVFGVLLWNREFILFIAAIFRKEKRAGSTS